MYHRGLPYGLLAYPESDGTAQSELIRISKSAHQALNILCDAGHKFLASLNENHPTDSKPFSVCSPFLLLLLRGQVVEDEGRPEEVC